MNLSWRTKVLTAVMLGLLLNLPAKNPVAAPVEAKVVQATPINLSYPAKYPKLEGKTFGWLTARAVVVADVDSGTVMWAKNADELLFPASTTKIMTAMVAAQNMNLNQIVTVEQASDTIGHSMNLVKNETISVKNLLYGLLVESGNDAALALAQGYPGGYNAFVKAMNDKAKQLNLKQTVYKNVSGVEQDGHVTTARDLVTLAKEVKKTPLLSRMVATKSITVTSTDGKQVHQLENINELLGVVPGLTGIKTGWTEVAGECLVAWTEREGHKIVTVVLGSQDRFGETERLINWAFANFDWVEIEV